MKQLFAYTAPTAPVGFTPYLQAFESPDAGRIIIHARAGSGAIAGLSLGPDDRRELARVLLAGLPPADAA